MQRSASACKSFIGVPRSFPPGPSAALAVTGPIALGVFPFASVVCLRKLFIRFCVVLAGGSPVGRPAVPRPGSHVRVDRRPRAAACAAGSPAGRVGAQRPHAGVRQGRRVPQRKARPRGVGQGLSATNARLRARLLCRSYIANSLLPTRNMTVKIRVPGVSSRARLTSPRRRRVRRARAAPPTWHMSGEPIDSCTLRANSHCRTR
jgi:hypothetical protein